MCPLYAGYVDKVSRLETDFEKRWSWGELAALERILAF